MIHDDAEGLKQKQAFMIRLLFLRKGVVSDHNIYKILCSSRVKSFPPQVSNIIATEFISFNTVQRANRQNI